MKTHLANAFPVENYFFLLFFSNSHCLKVSDVKQEATFNEFSAIDRVEIFHSTVEKQAREKGFFFGNLWVSHVSGVTQKESYSSCPWRLSVAKKRRMRNVEHERQKTARRNLISCEVRAK